MKDIQSCCVLPRNVPVAKPFADDGPILALDEGVVIGLACAALRLFDLEASENARDTIVDVLRSVVAVESFDHEGEQRQRFLKHRLHELLRDLLHREHDFPLCDHVDEIDVVHTFFFPLDLPDAPYPHGGSLAPHRD